MDVCIDGVQSLLLQFVGGNLVHQADATTFLNEIDDGTFTFLLNELHGLVQLLTAVTALAAEDVACGTTGVHSYEHRLVGGPFSLDEGDMLQTVALLTEGDDTEVSVSSGHVCLHAFFHKAFALQAIGDEVFDLDEFHVELLSLFDELGHPCHGAVGIENLDEGGGRFQSSQTGQVDGSLGMSRTAQHTIILCIERIDMSGTTEVA